MTPPSRSQIDALGVGVVWVDGNRNTPSRNGDDKTDTILR